MVLTPRVTRSLTAAVAAASLALLAVGGVAVATEEAPPIINGCVDKKTSLLRIATEAKPCNLKTETALSWNQQGPAGVPGADADPAITHALDARTDALEEAARTLQVARVSGMHETEQTCGPDPATSHWTCTSTSIGEAYFTSIGHVRTHGLNVSDTTGYPGCFPGSGTATWQAADGEINFDTIGESCPTDDDEWTRVSTQTWTITSGTGRYENATGTMNVRVRTGNGSDVDMASILHHGTITLAE
jgi:hypothetical protein